MADAEEEGGQSENKKDDFVSNGRGKPFSTMHQEIESKLSKPGSSYEGKVSIVLSGWDHLAGSASVGQLSFATFLYRWTLQLVLQGDWPKLEKIVKTRLKATLQRCTCDSILEPLCRILLPLVTDPWGHPILKSIISGSTISDKEVEEYINDETWEVLKVRVNTMVESRCEKLALSVLKVCMRCMQLQSNRDPPEVPLHSKQDHNHFVDLYFVLLYKFEKTNFYEELKDLNFEDGVDLVRRLLAQQEKGKVWKHRLKIIDLAIHIFLASSIHKPHDSSFWSVFTVWCDVMLTVETNADLLTQMIRKYIQLAESSKHIYTMASIFHHKFGSGHATLVTELLIKALTLDLNSIERVKHDREEVKEQNRLEVQMAAGFMDLADVFNIHERIARECILTAFSLHPTLVRLDKLRSFTSQSPTKDPNSAESHLNVDSKMTSHSRNPASFTVIGSYLFPETGCSKGNSDSPPVIDATAKIKEENDISTHDYEENNVQPNSESDTNSTQLFNGNTEASSFNTSNVPHIRRGYTPPSNSSFLSYHDHYDSGSSGLPKECNSNEVGLDLTKDGPHFASANLEYKGSYDADSMDGFNFTAEGLIEQLHGSDKPKPPKREVDTDYDILTAPHTLLNEESLGMDKELCDDLAVVLSSPRWQLLSWSLNKEDLINKCEKYLGDVESAKNLTKELKFLDIDYNLFRHLPSEDIDQYTGIEKGYEHFMDEDSDQDDVVCVMPNRFSSGLDIENRRVKRGVRGRGRVRRGRPPLRARHYGSDSDSTGYTKPRNWTTTSFSDSDSDLDSYNLTFETKTAKGFEGKRVTAVSSNDRCNERCKRLRVDAATGRVRAAKGHINHLRLYRHNPFSLPHANQPPTTYAPSLGSVNLNPSVILSKDCQTAVSRSPDIKQEPIASLSDESSRDVALEIAKNLPTLKVETKTEELSEASPLKSYPNLPQQDKSEKNWKYSGYLVSNVANPANKWPSLSVPQASSPLGCSYRTREGRLVTLNTHKQNESSQSSSLNYLRNVSSSRYPSTFEESFTKFLLQQNSELKDGKKPSVTITRKTVPLNSSFDLLKRQGTSVTTYRRNTTTALANAQKNVLNRIMAPENARLGENHDQNLPIRAIAMPVSHNPPNISPDKNNPPNLSRVLPKGTTVVRRPKSDSGAGPSGLNNGGTGMSVISRSQLIRPLPSTPRPTVSITPSSSSSFFTSNSSEHLTPTPNSMRSNLIRTSTQQLSPPVQEDAGSSSHQESLQALAGPSPPLTSATVVGSISQGLISQLSSITSSPKEIQGGSSVPIREVALLSGRSVSYSSLNQISNAPTTTTVASYLGEHRPSSMLESLLRERSPTSPSVVPVGIGGTALTTTTSSLPEPLVVSSPAITGVSVSPSTTLSEALNLVTSHSSVPVSLGSITTAQNSSLVASESDNRSLILNTGPATGSLSTSSLLGVSNMNVPVVGHNLPPSGGGIPVTLAQVSGNNTNIMAGSSISSVAPSSESSNMHQLLLPAHLIQVQGSDGSTGLGIVHSGSLDLRLPPGTRVIKSSNNTVRPAAPLAISQANSRQVNVLHNVKIVQNRQIVRTVVVPHSVALQSIGSQQGAQLVAISQNSGASNSGVEIPSTSRIPTQLHKMLGTNVVPGGLVIRAVRPQAANTEATIEEAKPVTHTTHTNVVHHPAQVIMDDKDKNVEKSKVIQTLAQEEGLGERLTRHYLKAALLTTTSTQSVGTQTQTTAVKPVTGQIVNQVLMNPLRGIASSSINALPTSASVSSLPLPQSNVVSSETLEQLREFESVFEKVSNKSVKESEGDSNQQTFTSSSISSEESMIAAQLLSMANETPTVTSGASFVNSVHTSTTPENNSVTVLTSSAGTNTSANGTSAASATVGGGRVGEGAFITIPCTTQAGTLILVNPSVATSSLMTMAGNTIVSSQPPPPPASPALSSTSSHSSVASSPSSTSSKTKNQSKPKVSPTSASPSPARPKSPPPPKAPPKPAVAKPQVEESDETKARIQAILDKYKQDLANNPQPQPAPRNRKNCPPPKNEGKSSSKKKGQVKKTDGGPSPSPQASDSGHLPSLSASPAPLSVSAVGEDSDGSVGGSSISFLEEKPKIEETTSPQILQGVMVSNVKVDNNSISPNVTTIPANLAGGRVYQLIRQGNKVTAITAQQSYSKVKTGLTQGGPPPNVTIQGRFNLSDLMMESQIASLLSGGTSTVTQGSSMIGKLLQSQQLQPSVQQVVVQASGQQGQPVLQQISLQPVITTHTKSQLHNRSSAGCGSILVEPKSPLMQSPIKQPPSSQSSPGLPAVISTSPGTPQQRPLSPQSPPSTPSPFPSHEEDTNSSEQSSDSGTPAGPLPPFFTLTKQFMIPPQGQQFTDKPLGDNHFSQSTSSQGTSGQKASLDLSNNDNSPASTSQMHCSATFSRSRDTIEKSESRNKAKSDGVGGVSLFCSSTPSSPIVVVSASENVLNLSPGSDPSSLEGSPVAVAQRDLVQGATSDVRSNSMDSLKTDISVEEEQIPPSPATLTKQLQNAYMTEAALSPVVSQAQLSSNSSFSSPATVQDLHFAESHGDQRSLSPGIGSASLSYSIAGPTNSMPITLGNSSSHNLSVNGGLEACLSSPSGDVYLHQAGVGLGLDVLPLEESHTHSPSLSDLVPAVPLLSWSPRSADSLMAQSPCLNEALSSNIALDVHHSEDSLCDSSTGLPALFSMEGDGASVSSSTSEDLPSSLANSTNTSLFPVPSASTSSLLTLHVEPSSSRRVYSNTMKGISNREQDHTISSTHTEELAEDRVHSLGLVNVALSSGSCDVMTHSPSTSDNHWRFDVSDSNKSSDVLSDVDMSAESKEDDMNNPQRHVNKKRTKRISRASKVAKMNDKESNRRRRSLRQVEVLEKKSQQSKNNTAHNGYEKELDELNAETAEQSSDVKVLRSKKISYSPSPTNERSSRMRSEGKDGAFLSLIKDEKPNCEMKSLSSPEVKKELKPDPDEPTARITRGLKRRSEGANFQEDKKTKSCRSESEEKTEEDKGYDEGDILPLKSLRGRNISGTSDSSSNYSIDRVSTPSLQGSPIGSGSGGGGGARRRRRRISHDSSVSSRDGSPLTLIQGAQSQQDSNLVNTRRSSSRDHAKKTLCGCCVDQQQAPQSSSSRRSSGRASRSSGPSSS